LILIIFINRKYWGKLKDIQWGNYKLIGGNVMVAANKYVTESKVPSSVVIASKISSCPYDYIDSPLDVVNILST
jgi:hypothetical protein